MRKLGRWLRRGWPSTAAVVANRVASCGVVLLPCGSCSGGHNHLDGCAVVVERGHCQANPIRLGRNQLSRPLWLASSLLWKHSETFRTIVIAVWAAVKSAIG